jgi:hypothetical protein
VSPRPSAGGSDFGVMFSTMLVQAGEGSQLAVQAGFWWKISSQNASHSTPRGARWLRPGNSTCDSTSRRCVATLITELPPTVAYIERYKERKPTLARKRCRSYVWKSRYISQAGFRSHLPVLRDHREEGTTAARCATAFSRAHRGAATGHTMTVRSTQNDKGNRAHTERTQ